MFCARCDRPIRPDQAREEREVFSASGPGRSVTVHAWACRRLPRQTAPSGPGAR